MAHDLTGDTAAVLPGEAVEVGAADPGGGDPQQDLAGAGSGCRSLLDIEMPEVREDERTHEDSFVRLRWSRMRTPA
jgi:hypothetical protein